MEPTIKPIRPKDVPQLKEAFIPPEVIEAVNYFIVERCIRVDASFDIKQEEIMTLALSKMNPGTRFNIEWLNFEELYGYYGWDVTYDRPSIGDNYAAYFTFEAKPQ